MFNKLVPGSSIITRVQKSLRSYYEAGLVDSFGFGDQIRKALTDIGLSFGQDLEIRLPVHNGKIRLPEGVQRVDRLYWEGDKPVPIYPTSQAPSRCSSTYTQSGNQLFLDRTEGVVRVLYQGVTDTSVLPELPDEPILLDYLVKKLIYEQFHDWYLNGEVDNIDRKLELVQQDYDLAYRNALYWEKLPSYEQLFHHTLTRPGNPITR